ncbi:MAG: protein kinase [Pseudomonadota bacterium]
MAVKAVNHFDAIFCDPWVLGCTPSRVSAVASNPVYWSTTMTGDCADVLAAAKVAIAMFSAGMAVVQLAHEQPDHHSGKALTDRNGCSADVQINSYNGTATDNWAIDDHNGHFIIRNKATNGYRHALSKWRDRSGRPQVGICAEGKSHRVLLARQRREAAQTTTTRPAHRHCRCPAAIIAHLPTQKPLARLLLLLTTRPPRSMHDSIVQRRANHPITDPVEVDSATARPSYTFVAAIAQGGMGYVELCCRREGRFLRWEARKRLHTQLRSDPVFRTMFMDEARVAGLVRHPNVVSVSDVGEDADGPYLIMDYVEGVSLSRLFRQAARDRRRVPLQVAVRICKDAAIGLHAAHEVRAEDGSPLNLVHRDVSPQNVLIGYDGSVRVTDFGIAKALGNVNQTSAGVLKGNMGYLSPEQLRFEEPDRRSDLFSLGVTMYELLSGQRLYSNKAGFEGTRRILSEPAPDIRAVRPEVPDALAELTLEMLSKETTGRPATALEVGARLESILVTLLATEGSMTVADYMDRHFATARDRHRAVLSEQLRRSEATLAGEATPRSMPPDLVLTTMERRTAPAKRGSWRPIAAAALAVGLMAFAGVRLTRPPRVAAAAPAPTAPRPTIGVEIVPLPPRLAAPMPAAIPPPITEPVVEGPPPPPAPLLAAAPKPVAPKRKPEARRDSGRSAHGRHPAATTDSGAIAVPLFTRWR